MRPSVSFKDLLEEEEGLVKSVSISRKKNKIVKENVSQVDEKPQSTRYDYCCYLILILLFYSRNILRKNTILIT